MVLRGASADSGAAALFGLVAVVLAVFFGLIAQIFSGGSESKPQPIVVGEIGEDWEEQRYPGIAKIDALFEQHIATLPEFISYFNVRVAGTKHRNRDGSSRIAVIRKCETLEELFLRVEPDNPVDPKAIAIHREDGGQLGYVDHITAMRIRYDQDGMVEWRASFRYASKHPETNRIVGADIYLVRLKTGQGMAAEALRRANSPLRVNCPTCGAEADKRCVTKSGGDSGQPHVGRVKALQELKAREGEAAVDQRL